MEKTEEKTEAEHEEENGFQAALRFPVTAFSYAKNSLDRVMGSMY